MVLYSISFTLLLLAFTVAGYRKRGHACVIRLPLYLATSAVLALPTMLPLLVCMVCIFNIELTEWPCWKPSSSCTSASSSP